MDPIHGADPSETVKNRRELSETVGNRWKSPKTKKKTLKSQQKIVKKLRFVFKISSAGVRLPGSGTRGQKVLFGV